MNATCAHCNKAIQEESRFCPHCGQPQPNTEKKCRGCGQVVPADATFCHNCGESQIEKPTSPNLDLTCRKCGSEKVKKLSIAYAEGLSNVNLEHVGVGIGIGGGGLGLGIGVGDSKGTNQTLRSRQLAPPELSNNSVTFGVLALLLLVVTIVLLAISLGAAAVAGVFAALFGCFAYSVVKENETVRQEKIRWESSFVCLRCGEVFVQEKEYERNRERERLRALRDSGDELFKDQIVD